MELPRCRENQANKLGPIACLAAVALLAVVIGLERGSALEQRYIILGATLVFTIYLCLSLIRHWTASLARGALALMAVVLLPWNAAYAFSFGEARRAFESNFVNDIRANLPVDLLATRYYAEIWGDPSLAASAIREMRDDRIGPFADGQLQLNEAPPAVAAEETLSVTPVEAHNMTRVGDHWQGTGGDSFLLYAVNRSHLAGLRLTYTLSNASARPAYLQLAWSRTRDGTLDEKGQHIRCVGRADHRPAGAAGCMDRRQRGHAEGHARHGRRRRSNSIPWWC